jgi:homoserine dehydrogenase
MRYDLALVGFGHVGRRFARLLEERAGCLAHQCALETRIVGICTRRHGTARNAAGIDGGRAAGLVEAGHRLDLVDAPDGFPAPPATGVEFIEQLAAVTRAPLTGRLVVVETTLLDIAAGQPAIDHVRAALRAGAHVVTANKGPVAFAYADLRARARAANRAFLFEGAVMDGIPVFNLARTTLPAVSIRGFRGVVNSTTNYIITAMEHGRELAESLTEMQVAGIAEADASLDVDGWDAAAKAAALANVLLEGRLTPQEVERTGIGGLTGAAVREAAARGRRIKLVASGTRRGEGVTARVAPEELPAGDLLATLRDQQNALVLDTDLLGEFSIVQLGGGLTQTAYALLSDLVALAAREG